MSSCASTPRAATASSRRWRSWASWPGRAAASATSRGRCRSSHSSSAPSRRVTRTSGTLTWSSSPRCVPRRPSSRGGAGCSSAHRAPSRRSASWSRARTHHGCSSSPTHSRPSPRNVSTSPSDRRPSSPMCGIVGYIGPRDAAPILLEGLSRLEYRGYDSAGIALVTPAGDLFVEKRAGKLVNLRTALAESTPQALVGLAHTRWATHGRPNDLNAHPHVDCTGAITVIHNGIIENFRELRDALTARGHRFDSETDTEVLAHLIEEAYQGDIAEATREALR